MTRTWATSAFLSSAIERIAVHDASDNDCHTAHAYAGHRKRLRVSGCASLNNVHVLPNITLPPHAHQQQLHPTPTLFHLRFTLLFEFGPFFVHQPTHTIKCPLPIPGGTATINSVHSSPRNSPTRPTSDLPAEPHESRDYHLDR